MRDNDLIVGLDVGTSKITAIVGYENSEGGIEVVGTGNSESKGIKKGVVNNIEQTVFSIKRAVEEAELMAGCEIHSVFVGIAGSHIEGINSDGVVSIRDREVSESDLERVIDAAKAVSISSEKRVIHVLPQEYKVDEQDGIKDPLGMTGVRLEAKVHVVTCAYNALQNIEKCIHRCDLDVENVILEQYAASGVILSPDEKDLGVCLIDIGGGTTDIAIFINGSISYSAVIPVAGDQITNDIAMAIRTPVQHAEKIKIRYACALSSLARSDETIMVPAIGNRPSREISRQALVEVIEPRYQEILQMAKEALNKSGYSEMIAGGVVLTGGTACMEGSEDLAEEIFDMPVRTAYPQDVTGLTDVVSNPIYSTSIGLLKYGIEQHKQKMKYYSYSKKDKKEKGRFFGLIKSWLKGNF